MIRLATIVSVVWTMHRGVMDGFNSDADVLGLRTMIRLQNKNNNNRQIAQITPRVVTWKLFI